MEADQYQKIKNIFQSVLEAPAGERPRLLEEQCGDDAAMRGEVERLLNSYESGFLEQPAVGEVAESVVPEQLGHGREIGRYKVLRSIGKGGMGEVYLAEDSRLARQVALKVLPGDLAEDADRLSRFEQEAKAASALNHPNILTIFEFAQENGSHFIVSEYVSGRTLRSKISDCTFLVDEVLDIAVQAAAALEAAHSNGIIHRDIKPENIMVRDDGLVKVLDFGLAKFTDHWFGGEGMLEGSPTRKQLTTPGIIMGTVQYMSPEQTRGQATDARTDIWSLGCVIYEMLAGRPAFEGEGTADLIAEIVKTHPSRLTSLVEEVPERLDEIVAKALEKNADERYQTAKDLLIDLNRVKKKREVEAELSRSFPLGDRNTSRDNAVPGVEGKNDVPEKPISSAEYILDGIRIHRRTAVGILGLIAAMLGTTAYVARTYWREPENPNEARYAYANKIKLAAQAIETSNLPLAKQYLEELTPKKGEEDLRSFEWGYLSGLYSERQAFQPVNLTLSSWVEGTAFSPDGAYVATACTDGTVQLWDVASAESIRSFKGHEGGVWSAVFSPDGRRLLTSGMDKRVILWDVETGTQIHAVGGKSDPVLGPLFSPDGKTILAIGSGKLRRWDATNLKETPANVSLADRDLLYSISPDGKYLGARAKDGTAAIIETINGRTVSRLKGHASLTTDLEFSPDSRWALSGSTDGTAKLWDIRSGRDLRTFRGHAGETYDVAFSPDGKTIATGNTDNTVKLWDAEKGFEITTRKGHLGRVQALAFSPDGRKLATGSSDNTAKIWTVPKNEGRGVLRGHEGPVRSVAISSDAKLIASASEDRTAKVWDAATEDDRLTLTGHGDTVNSVDFAADDKTLVTGSQDKRIRTWDVVTGRQLLNINTQKGGVVAFYSPEGSSIATGHFFADEDMELWSAATQKQVCAFEYGSQSAWDMSFTKDGKQVTASGGNVIKVWDARTCEELWRYEGSPEQAFAALFSTTDKLVGIEVLNNSRSLKLFDPISNKELAVIRGHDSDITSASLSPDGRRLVTSAEDASIKIWDVVTGQELLSIVTNAGKINSVTFSSDGEILVAAAEDATIRIWRASPMAR